LAINSGSVTRTERQIHARSPATTPVTQRNVIAKRFDYDEQSLRQENVLAVIKLLILLFMRQMRKSADCMLPARAATERGGEELPAFKLCESPEMPFPRQMGSHPGVKLHAALPKRARLM
jgi:hypothetical protein